MAETKWMPTHTFHELNRTFADDNTVVTVISRLRSAQGQLEIAGGDRRTSTGALDLAVARALGTCVLLLEEIRDAVADDCGVSLQVNAEEEK